MLSISDGSRKILIPASRVFFDLPVSASSASKLDTWNVWNKLIEEEEKKEVKIPQTSKESESHFPFFSHHTETEKETVLLSEELKKDTDDFNLHCDLGTLALYDYVTEKAQCFALKGLSLDTDPETKRLKLNGFYQKQIQDTYASFDDFQSILKSYLGKFSSLSSVPSASVFSTLYQKFLFTRTMERAAIRLGAEFNIHLQFMDLECLQEPNEEKQHKGGSTTLPSASYCLLQNGMPRVKGHLDDIFQLQDSQLDWIQKQLIFWNDLYAQYSHKKKSGISLSSVEDFIFIESQLWHELIEYFIHLCKREESDILQVFRHVQQGTTLLTDPEQLRPHESQTYLNLGLSLLDKIADSIKVSITNFFLDKQKQLGLALANTSRESNSPKAGWTVDILASWSLFAFVAFMFYSSERNDFLSKEQAWKTLLFKKTHLLRTALPPILDYFFYSLLFYLDPVLIPSFSSSSSAEPSTTLWTSNRFDPNYKLQSENQPENKQKIDWNWNSLLTYKPFFLLPCLPCDIKLKSHLVEITDCQLKKLKINLYKYRWNHFAHQYFGLQGESKNFLGHELETIFPGTVKMARDFQCIRYGILKYYLHHIAPLLLNLSRS